MQRVFHANHCASALRNQQPRRAVLWAEAPRSALSNRFPRLHYDPRSCNSFVRPRQWLRKRERGGAQAPQHPSQVGRPILFLVAWLREFCRTLEIITRTLREVVNRVRLCGHYAQRGSRVLPSRFFFF